MPRRNMSMSRHAGGEHGSIFYRVGGRLCGDPVRIYWLGAALARRVRLGHVRRGDSRDESIALFGQGFNIKRPCSSLAQREPDLPDAVVQPLVEFDEGGIVPDA